MGPLGELFMGTAAHPESADLTGCRKPFRVGGPAFRRANHEQPTASGHRRKRIAELRMDVCRVDRHVGWATASPFNYLREGFDGVG